MMKVFFLLASLFFLSFSCTTENLKECINDWDCDIRGFWDEVSDDTYDEKSNALYLQYRANFVRFDGTPAFFEAQGGPDKLWMLAGNIMQNGWSSAYEWEQCNVATPEWVYIYKKQHYLGTGQEGQADTVGYFVIYLDKAFKPTPGAWSDYCDDVTSDASQDIWRWVYPEADQKIYSTFNSADYYIGYTYGYVDSGCRFATDIHGVKSQGRYYQSGIYPSQLYMRDNIVETETISFGCDSHISSCGSWYLAGNYEWTGKGKFADTNIDPETDINQQRKADAFELPVTKAKKRSTRSNLEEPIITKDDSVNGICLLKTSGTGFNPKHISYHTECSSSGKLMMMNVVVMICGVVLGLSVF